MSEARVRGHETHFIIIIIIIVVVVVVFIKSCQNATYTQIKKIQHTYHKIITEELVAFVSKLSVVASCSEIVVLICFIRE